MVTKEKSGNLFTFMITLIVCLSIFICPAHAAQLQGADADNAGTVTEIREGQDQEMAGQGTENKQLTSGQEGQSEEGQPAQKQPTEGKPTEGQPTEGQPTEGQPAQKQPTEGQPTEGQSTQGQPTEGQPTEGQPTEGQPTQGQPTEGQPTEGQPTEGQSTQGQPTEGQPTEGQPTEGQPTEGQSTEGQLTQGQPTQTKPEKEAAISTPEKAAEKAPVTPAVRPLKDGTYVIVSRINRFKALQAQSGSKASGKQIELRDCDGSNTQKFKLVGDKETGYYSITNVKSGKLLAIKGDKAADGTAIVQNKASSCAGQKWIIVKKNGYYMLQSALDGTPFVLTLENGSVANGTDAVLQEAKEAASQLFSFLVSKPSVKIKEGVYEINTALNKNNNMKLRIASGSMKDKANLQIYKDIDAESQKFIVEKAGSDQYTLTSYNSGKAVALAKNSKAAKTNVIQYSKNEKKTQKWIIRNAGDGTVYISNAYSGLSLEVEGGKAASKSNVFVNKATGSKAQKFTMTKVADSKLKPIANGMYLIHSEINSNRVVGVEDASRLQCANIQLQYKTGASFQRFKFTYAGNGYYKIMNVKSKHMVDLKDGGLANKTNIQQYKEDGTKAQLWLPHKNKNGTYSFISAKSSKAMEVAGMTGLDSTNIRAFTYKEYAPQQFTLTKTSGSDKQEIKYGKVKEDSVKSAMCRKAQDYSSSTNYLVLVNTSEHRAILFRWLGGRWITDMDSPVTLGKASTPTPKGTFTVYNHWKYFDGDYSDSKLTYQCWWSTCFYGPYYFHSVLYDYNSGYPGRVRDGRMKINASHGCIRMPVEKALYLYEHSPIGTKVRVY